MPPPIKNRLPANQNNSPRAHDEWYNYTASDNRKEVKEISTQEKCKNLVIICI